MIRRRRRHRKAWSRATTCTEGVSLNVNECPMQMQITTSNTINFRFLFRFLCAKFCCCFCFLFLKRFVYDFSFPLFGSLIILSLFLSSLVFGFAFPICYYCFFVISLTDNIPILNKLMYEGIFWLNGSAKRLKRVVKLKFSSHRLFI